LGGGGGILLRGITPLFGGGRSTGRGGGVTVTMEPTKKGRKTPDLPRGPKRKGDRVAMDVAPGRKKKPLES